MIPRRLLPVLLAASLLGPVSAARSAELRVDLRNDASQSVSVPVGSDNGVTSESDFVAAADNASVTIYPLEIFSSRFWSQPLSEEDYARVRVGTEVRPARLDKVTRAVVRANGEVRRAEIAARQEEARRQFIQRKIDDLKYQREEFLERKDVLDDRIAAAESSLADEEGRMEWLTNSEDDGIDRSLQTIQDLADRRDELQSQRESLSRNNTRADVGRQSAEIRRLNDRISSERDSIRAARDRKRAAKTSYMSRRMEWQKLVADRRALRNEIQSIDRKIRDLAEKKQRP